MTASRRRPARSAIDAGLGDDAITFDFRLVEATITWSGNHVTIDGPSSHTVLSGFERYAFTDGIVDNSDGNPLVDDLFYFSRNHDVWNAQADPDQHYESLGWHEGRDPNAFFSTSIYLSANSDVRAANVNPLTHFDQMGWQEGRIPSLAFDPNQYLATYPDVAAAHIDPLAHFLQNGYQEGRQPFAPTELIAANGFDYVYYLSHNPDVAAAHVDPLSHFQTVGWQEGRNPNALFDTAGYLATYADVAAAHVNPLTALQPVRLARRTRPVGEFRHDGLSRGLCGRRGRRRQSAGALSPVRPARRPLAVRRWRLGLGHARPPMDQLCRRSETVLSPRPFAEGRENSMRVRHLGAALIGLSVMLTTAQAQRPVWDQTGTLNCDVSAGFGFIVGSQRQVNCLFTPSYPAPPEQYVGTITKIGLDIGVTAGRLPGLGRAHVDHAPPRCAGRLLRGRLRRSLARSGPRGERAGRRQRPLGRAAAALRAGPDRHQHRSRHRRDRAAVRTLTLSVYL